VSLYEQDSFEDEFTDLGTCVAMYSFDGEYITCLHLSALSLCCMLSNGAVSLIRIL